MKWTRLSCHDFVDNQVRLQLFALAYNLGNFFRQVALPKSVRHWTMTTLREKVIKIGAKVVSHARYIIFQMAEVAVSRELFAAILGRIHRLGFSLRRSGNRSIATERAGMRDHCRLLRKRGDKWPSMRATDGAGGGFQHNYVSHRP